MAVFTASLITDTTDLQKRLRSSQAGRLYICFVKHVARADTRPVLIAPRTEPASGLLSPASHRHRAWSATIAQNKTNGAMDLICCAREPFAQVRTRPTGLIRNGGATVVLSPSLRVIRGINLSFATRRSKRAEGVIRLRPVVASRMWPRRKYLVMGVDEFVPRVNLLGEFQISDSCERRQRAKGGDWPM